ncbi:calponin-like domain-containing protein [Phthorimaea operculella]|nr:calponin-like domain-containing protein [Phthorimaea operculella]
MAAMIQSIFPQPQRMASVWKRLQRVNKRAAKFQYTASYHRIDLETSAKWKPNKLSIVWTRRSRRVVTDAQEWEPSLKDPLKGSVQFTVPENHTVAVTLFKDSRTNELEDKDWTFVLEDVSSTGKRRRLACCAINMRKYASLEPSQRTLLLTLQPTTHKIVSAAIQLTLHCVLLREGQATDEDMQSLASLLSVNNNSDIAVLEDLDEDDYTLSDNSTRQMHDLRREMEEMTQSLTNSDIAATPNSVQSLNFDNSRTPTAPVSPTTPELDTPTNEVPIQKEVEKRDELKELKITEEKEKPKSRSEFLPSLTRLAMKEPAKPANPARGTAGPTVTEPGIKGATFRASTVVKRNLKPLELKTNLNSINLDKNDNESEQDGDTTPTAERIPAIRMGRDKTPVQDLLEWCQMVTKEYRSCKVTNLTTSFRSGLAFCAIIHRYRPDLIDFSGLQPDDAERNVRTALDASSKLGISQVLTAADVCSRPTPDRLAIMTYLFQLRAHFTGNELQVEQLGNDETESSYLVGRHDTDGSLPPELFSREVSYLVGRHDTDGSLPPELFSREVSTRRSRNMEHKPKTPVSQDSIESRQSQERATPDKTSPTAMKDVRDMFLQQSKTILNKMLSPPVNNKSNTKWFADPVKVEPLPPKPERLMTRKELTDPFGSDEEDEQPPTNQNNQSNAHSNGLQNNSSQNSETAKPEQPTTPTSPISDPLGVTRAAEPPPAAEKTRPPAAAVSPDLPKPTPQLLSRHDELKERARLLLEQTKKEAREKARKQKEREDNLKMEAMNGVKNGELSPSKKPLSEEDRQAILRERARKLIADARAGVISPTSPLSPNRARGGTVEIITKQSVMEEFAAAGGMEQMDAILARAESHSTSSHGSRKSSASPDRSEERNSDDTKSVKSGSLSAEENSRRSPLQSFSAIIDRLTPDKENIDDGQVEKGSYIQSELEALEREQCAIDEKAAALEKELRRVMESADNSESNDSVNYLYYSPLYYIQSELEALEREQCAIDEKAAALEKELRRVMESADNSESTILHSKRVRSLRTRAKALESELEALECEQCAIDEKAAALEKELRRVMESADNSEVPSYIQSELEALEREQCAIDEKAAALEKELRRVMESADNSELETLERELETLERELETLESELEALEREQCAIDEKAAALEKELRRVMESADNSEEEDKLMSQWFNLVNKKNALLRRQMQLNILEQEEDLSRRCELLARELRLSLGVEEWRKTAGQKRRERLLLQELLSAVNERDRLVQEMDEQEKAIAEDAEIAHNLSQVEIQRKNNCILQ